MFSEAQETDQAPVASKAPQPYVDITSDIKAKLAEQNSTVREQYVDNQVRVKLNERVSLVDKAVGVIATKRKELEKIRPTQLFDADGKVASETFTKENIEARKKLNEAITKVEKALVKAFDTAVYTDLENALK